MSVWATGRFGLKVSASSRRIGPSPSSVESEQFGGQAHHRRIVGDGRGRHDALLEEYVVGNVPPVVPESSQAQVCGAGPGSGCPGTLQAREQRARQRPGQATGTQAHPRPGEVDAARLPVGIKNSRSCFR